MSTPYFPNITAEQLTPIRAVQQFIQKDPAYLSHASCPYNEATRKLLTEILVAGAGAGAGASLNLDEVVLDTADGLIDQLDGLYRQLMTIQGSIHRSDGKDKVQWAKAMVSILDRLVGLKERAVNLKNFSDFQKVVLSFLDETLEPSQRTSFVDRLGQYVEQTK